MGEDLKTTEKKVLSVYQKVNPSYRPIENDPELFDNMRRMREGLFFHRLKLPKKLFKDSRIVSFGCGTGELSFFTPSGAQR